LIMTDSGKPAPILQVIGIEGHLYTSLALKQEFKRPLAGVVLLQRLEGLLSEKWQKEYDRLFFFSHFFNEHIGRIKKLPIDELDRRQLSLEKAFGIASSALLASYDRSLYRKSDFRSMREVQLIYLMFAEQILSEIRPAFALDGVAHYFQVVLRRACQAIGVPYLNTAPTRGIQRVAVHNLRGRQIGMRSVFERQQAQWEPPEEFLEYCREADACYADFLDKPKRPVYAEKNSRVSINLKRSMQMVQTSFSKEHRAHWRDNPVDRHTGHVIHPLVYLRRGIRDRIRSQVQNALGIMDARPDLSQPFIYLPLHYTPEVSDLVFGSAYTHHEGLVSLIAKYIPTDTRLYVKEHTSMLGRRPGRFYKALNKLYNVSVIAPQVSTFDLIRSCKAVLTVTGTAGWEAYLMNKPVIVLGDVFYNFLPGVLHTTLDHEFSTRLGRYLADFTPRPQERVNAMRAYYITSLPAMKGDISLGALIKSEEAPANAVLFAKALRYILENWGEELIGQLPTSLVSQ
jgi:hypothetical protein